MNISKLFKNLRESASSLVQEHSKVTTKNPHQRTLLFVGSRFVGKTTLINRFLDINEPAKKTLALEYTFARKTSSHSLAKDVCHIWELGGGPLFTSVLENEHTLTQYGPLTVVIMLDLSELNQMWSCFESLLDTIKTRMKTIGLSSSQRKICDHPDFNIMDPFSVPLVIVGAKYDIFQEFEPEKKKIVCRCLRYTSHILCANLMFYSSKDASLVKRLKDILNHYAFGAPQIKTNCNDYNKPLCIPCGSDLLESIEGVGATAKCSLEKARYLFTTTFPQDLAKAKNTVTDDPANDLNFREPLVDSLRRQKNEELDRYCQEMERRENRMNNSFIK